MKHIKSMKDNPKMTGKKGIRLKVTPAFINTLS